MRNLNEKNKKSYGGLSVAFGILSIILTVAFSSFCVILDLTGALNRSVTAGLIFVGLIFGVAGIFVSCMAHATEQKCKAATVGLICSIISVMLCVYSFILYLDMLYWWENILNAVAPGLLS